MRTRRFKVVDSRGRTTNCGTHDLDEAARDLLSAHGRGERIRVKYGNGRELSHRDARAIAERAAEMSIATEGTA